jgi:hypothetical protein
MGVCMYVCLFSSCIVTCDVTLSHLPPSYADGCMQWGQTAVHSAARAGHTGALQLLHELGLDFTVTTNVSEYLYT